MTVAALPSLVEYQENGVTTVFAVPFRFKAASDLRVSRIAGGVETMLALGADYAVTGGQTDAGGSITRTAATTGALLRIRRETALAQPMVYTTDDRFPAKSHEGALDTAILIDQEQQVAIDDVSSRAILLPPGEAGVSLPPANLRTGGNRVLGPHPVTGSIEVLDVGQQFKGDPGGNAMAIGLFAAASTLSIPIGTDLVQTSGWDLRGRGSARYVYSALIDAAYVTAHPRSSFRTANGRGFVLCEDWVHLGQFGAVGDGIVNDSVAAQAAIDFVAALGGGIVDVLPGIYRANVILQNRVCVRGAGRATRIVPAIADHVFQVAQGASITAFAVRDLWIEGNPAHAGCDGVNLSIAALGAFVDTIDLSNLLIQRCGRDGVRAVGMSSSGPFVQRLRLINVESRENRQSGLRLIGTVIETMVEHCSFSKPTDTTIDGKAVSLEYNGDYPLRVSFKNCLFDAANHLGVPGRKAYGLWLGAGANVAVDVSNFEFCDPCIATADFGFAAGVVVTSTNFGYGEDASDAVLIGRCNNLRIENCSVRVVAGKTLTNFVRYTSDMDGTRNVTVQNNRRDGTVLNNINEGGAYTQIVAGGVIRAYRDYITLVSESGTADDVATINDEDGGLSWLRPGASLTLVAQSGHALSIKHGLGNIRLRGEADLILTGNRQLTLRWNRQLGVWMDG